jgi:CBS domain-containing protein
MRTSPEAATATLTCVSDVMTRGFVAVPESAQFKQIVFALARNRVSSVPVVDTDRRVVGVVSEADLLVRIAGEGGTPPRRHHLTYRWENRHRLHAATAHELMTSPAITIAATATIAEAAHHCAHNRVRHLPVVDANGTLVGVVSRTDLLRVFLREDDEIVLDVESYIRDRVSVDPDSIAVSVTGGVVALTGQLERKLQMDALVEHVRMMPGVVDVDDKLSVLVDDTMFSAAPHITF